MFCTAPKTASKTSSFIDIAALLDSCSLFANLPVALKEQFAAQAQIRTQPKGSILFIQDDDADWFYLIIHGWIKLFRETIEGTEAVIDVLSTGHLFGDTSVFENGRYGYGAEVAEQAQYLMLPTALLKQAIASNNQMALNMLSSMSQHRRQQSKEIEHLTIQNAAQRIGCFLLKLCPLPVPPSLTLNLPYDKTLIAARLGMKPETFSRALAKLKADTQLEVSGSRVTINHVEQLVSYTCHYCSSSFPCNDIKGQDPRP